MDVQQLLLGQTPDLVVKDHERFITVDIISVYDSMKKVKQLRNALSHFSCIERFLYKNG